MESIKCYRIWRREPSGWLDEERKTGDFLWTEVFFYLISDNQSITCLPGQQEKKITYSSNMLLTLRQIMENSESWHLVYENVYCLHSKNYLGQRALMCLYPEIKDNIYIKSYNKGKTQPMLRVTAASLSGVTPGVTVQFCYSQMHSFHHSFKYLLRDSSMPETSIIIFCHCYLCLGLF